jgi:hypothetical protein
MTEVQKYLKEAHERMLEFEKQHDPERLREADRALENVELVKVVDPKVRVRLRAECLGTWLELVALLDRSIDPGFNPNDFPSKQVEPPAIPGAPSLEPGADPAQIRDPVARAAYERAIAANRAKTENYRVQTQLRRIGERVYPQSEIFIRRYYKAAPADQRELNEAVGRIIKDPDRKTRLSGLLAQ